MRTRIGIRFLLVAWFWCAGTSAFAGPGYQRQLEQALRGWNLNKAATVLERARSSLGEDDQVVQVMQARYLFFAGAYQQALDILQQIGINADTPTYGGFYAILKRAAEQVGVMKVYESEHFRYFVPAGKDELLVPYMQETAEQSYAALVQDFGADVSMLDEKIRIEVYPDVKGFSDISSLTLKEIQVSGTVALCKYNRLMITSPRTLARGYRWRDTLSHEMVHYFLTKLTENKVPLWLHEGIARFQEARWRNPEVGNFSLYDQSVLSEALARDYWVPLTAMEPSLAKLTKPGDTSLAFAEVFGMVRLLYARGGYHAIQQMLAGYRDGKKTRAVLDDLGFQSAEALMDALVVSLAQQKLAHVPGRRFLPVEEGNEDDMDTWGAFPQKARKRIHIGDLLRDRGRFQAAEKEYMLAVTQVQGVDPTIESRLAEVRLRDGRYDDAWVGVQKPLTMYEAHARLVLAAGKAAYFRKDYASARKLLEDTVGIHPFQPELFRLLADTYTRLGDEGRARKAREADEYLNQYSQVE